MAQMTVRMSEELLERLRSAALERSLSMNAYVEAILDAATNPELSSSEADRVRTRLRLAGLLEDAAEPAPGHRPPHDAVQQARRSATKGGGLSDVLVDQR
jgi:hypothetical protein